MVVEGPTSPHLCRSFETSVHTSAFKCFVRTFRPLYRVGWWETAIAECDSVTGIRLTVFARFRHRSGAKLNLVQAVHDSICWEINKSGLAGANLASAFSHAYSSLREANLVDGLLGPKTLATFASSTQVPERVCIRESFNIPNILKWGYRICVVDDGAALSPGCSLVKPGRR